MSECIACGGSGARSQGGECFPCKGTGATQEIPFDLSSASNEHYTPEDVVEASRSVLGEIDLDPASCELGQEEVKAQAWYGPGSPFGEDGLEEPWCGRVFLNPPGGRVPEAWAGMGTKSNAALWWGMLAAAWQSGEAEAAIFVGFTLEILRSAQALAVPQPLDFPMCVPKRRMRFDKVGEDGARVASTSPTNANVIVYLPPVTVEHRQDRDVLHHVHANRHTLPFVEAFTLIGRCRT